MLALVIGCVTVPVDVAPRFEDTREVCGLAPGALDTAAYLEPPELSPACVDAVLADFSADAGSLAEAGTLGTFLDAAAALLTADLVHLPEGPLGDELVDVSRVTGGDEVAGLLYDYAASRFTEVLGEVNDEVHAAVDPRSGRLLWSEGSCAGIDAAALLVHEARHRDGFEHVACREGGDPTCDVGEDGAWGFQRAVHELVIASTEDPLVRRSEEAWITSVDLSIR